MNTKTLETPIVHSLGNVLKDSRGNAICQVPDGNHAQVIVRAVNSHEALLEALKACLDWMEFTIPNLPRLSDKCPHCQAPVAVRGKNWGGPISKARNAIALAEGNK